MKTIGLIGGMSWESTIEYYRLANQLVKEKLGGLNSAKLLIYSVNFAEIEELMSSGQWEKVAEKITTASLKLKKGGADCILICTNTVHKVAEHVEKEVGLPLIHIADATAEAIKEKGQSTVGLLGTRFTMEQDFYHNRLENHDIKALIPNTEDIKIIDKIIFEELCLGIIKEESKTEYLRVIKDLKERGAEGIILGCTEIPLLISSDDCDLPLFDTTSIHANKAVKFALS